MTGDFYDAIKKFGENRIIDVDLAEQFLEVARIDIASSELLYAHNIPSASIYHLQQAVEKTVKGTMLLLGTDKEELIGKNGILHNTPKAFSKLLQEINTTNIVESVRQFVPVDVDKSKQEIDSILSYGKNLAALDANSITSIIDSMTSPKILEIPDQLTAPLNTAIAKAKQEGKPVDHITESVRKTMADFGLSLPLLFGLAVVTFAHSEYARYPGGQAAPKDYAQSIGVIQKYSQLITYLKSTHDTIMRFLEVVKKLRRVQNT